VSGLERGDSLRERLGAVTRGTRRTEGDPGDPPAADDALVVKTRLLERLVDEMGERRFDEGEEAVAVAIREFVAEVLDEEDLALNEAERERLAEELTAETLGLGPLATLMADLAVTDILVNGPDDVYVERHGRLERAGVRFRDEEHVVRVIERMAARVGRRIDVASPMLDARLPDGSRMNATLPPVSPDGPTISIRRFGTRRLRMDDLLRLGELSADMRRFLDLVVRERANMLITGGTGAGKSTLLGAMCEAVSSRERLVTIEDTAELALPQDHVVRLETRPPNVEGRGAIGARELVINALRMRPDRIIVGEVRGGEALDMLQAMNTGHDGSLCTLHANSPQDALRRLETMVLMAGLDLPSRAVREQVDGAIQFVVHVRRFEDGVRRIESIAELVGLEAGTPLLNEIFVFRRTGRGQRRIEGAFEPTGVVPRFVEALRDTRGIDVPTTLFGRPGREARE